MDSMDFLTQGSTQRRYTPAEISYMIEVGIYAFAMFLGTGACVYTVRRFQANYRRRVILAARLMSCKISLTVADLIVLFIYAPTQIIWITTYYWYGGDALCRATKFINTFSLHLTANMQVIIAADRLYITAHLRKVNQKSRFGMCHWICLAWFFAALCALPQLLVFHVSSETPTGEPQCVSIWTLLRYRKAIANEAYESSTAEEMDWDMQNSEHGSEKWYADRSHDELVEILERAYNIVHLLSIYIIPYTIELICYTLILLLMKSIHKDTTRKESAGARSGRTTTSCCGGTLSPTKCACATEHGEFVFQNIESPLVPSVPRIFERMDAKGGAFARQVLSSLPSTDGSSNAELYSKSVEHDLLHLSLLFDSCSVPTVDETDVDARKRRFDSAVQKGKSKAAWQVTMSVARRRTRFKAFAMLTLNLIFWTPYCALGMLSTLTVFDHSSFDFVNAFVVLNAVSNLLL